MPKKDKKQERGNPDLGKRLDTLAQLGTNGKIKLKKRAKAKYFTDKLVVKLAAIEGSNLTQSYWNTFHCNRSLSASDGRVSANYCNARWCLVCNRIRIAKMINGYVTPLSQLKDAWFVTLTVPNCLGGNLRAVIDEMNHIFKSIMEAMKKRKQREAKSYQIKGIRKLECTYNAVTESYHPHFHLLIEGEECARDIISEWLKRNSKCSEKAQDMRKADERCRIELFKYFAKIVTKTKDGNYGVYVSSLDVIFTAMRGLRVFQPIGIKKVSEDVDQIISEQINDIPDSHYEWCETDWFDVFTGESLTGYEADDAMRDLISRLI